MTKTKLEEKTEKHAVVRWRKLLHPDEWRFTSYIDGQEREPLGQDINVVISTFREISGYVEDHKIDWARKQLLIERQKYLIQGYAEITKQLEEITKLLEEENKQDNL